MQNLLKELGSDREQRWQRLLGSRTQREAAARRKRPEGFRFAYLVARPTAYRMCDEQARETGNGGVLQAGQTVWLERPLPLGSHRRYATGFTDSAGLVRVDARELAMVRP